MKRSEKSILLGVLVVMFCFSAVLLPAWSQAATTIVNPTGANVINAAIAASASGDTILVMPGQYKEGPQVVINNKNLTIRGEGRPLIMPLANTGDPSSGDNRGWWLVTIAGHLDLQNVVLDGTGYQISQAIRAWGTGRIENCEIRHIGWDVGSGYYGGSYDGRALSLYNNWTVTHNFIWDIERIGIFQFGTDVTDSKITDNIYNGKPSGDCLDYGIELGGGAKAIVTNNIVGNCLGVASADGSTSAGILITTLFAPGTTGTLSDNTVTNNTDGIAVGYDSADTSTVEAHNNYIYDNTSLGIDNTSSTNVVHAERNLWGTTDPAKIATMVAGNVIYNPPSVFGGTSSWTDYSGIVTTGKSVGIGTTSPLSTLHIAESNGSSVNRGMISSQHDNVPYAAIYQFRKSRGTIGSPSALLNGDAIGAIHAYSFDGNAYQRGASMISVVNGAVTPGSVPTDLTFQTGPGGTNTVERMRINSSGKVIVNDLKGTYVGGSAYVCVNNNGQLFTSETSCP